MKASEVLKQESDAAIARGNSFEGFMGMAPEHFSKEELVMICNVLYDKVKELRMKISGKL